MLNLKKCLVIAGVWTMGVVGILLMVKVARHRHCAGMYENVGKGLDEKLKESMVALTKATEHVQSVFEHIKNRKP